MVALKRSLVILRDCLFETTIANVDARLDPMPSSSYPDSSLTDVPVYGSGLEERVLVETRNPLGCPGVSYRRGRAG